MAAEYVYDLLSDDALLDAGLFKPAAVRQLASKVENGASLSETDDMALVGIISSQLVYQKFVKSYQAEAPLSIDDDVKVCVGHAKRTGAVA